MTLLEKPAATPAIALLDRLTRVPNFVCGRSAGTAGTSAGALCVVISTDLSTPPLFLDY